MKNGCQEPPQTWRMSSFLLRTLIMILMAGVIFTATEVIVDADADSNADGDA